ncbi:unknown [Eubacterium sp. CAG:786]|nr:unknown [Eubacterium sp. CAG:786]
MQITEAAPAITCGIPAGMSIAQESPQNHTAGSLMSYFTLRILQHTQSVNMQQITQTAHTISGRKPPRKTAGISRAAMNTNRSR